MDSVDRQSLPWLRVCNSWLGKLFDVERFDLNVTLYDVRRGVFHLRESLSFETIREDSEYVRIECHPLARYSDPGGGAIEVRSIANYIIIGRREKVRRIELTEHFPVP